MDRCDRCRLIVAYCMCAHIGVVEAATPILLFLHMLEAPRPSNTGRLAALALPNCRVVMHGGQHALAPPAVTGPTLLLHPEGRPLQSEDARRSPTLLVADGTWSQTRHMIQRVPLLRAAEKVSLPNALSQRASLRRRPSAQHLSTLEAIALALAIIESPRIETELLALLDIMIERTLRVRSSELPAERRPP